MVADNAMAAKPLPNMTNIIEIRKYSLSSVEFGEFMINVWGASFELIVQTSKCCTNDCAESSANTCTPCGCTTSQVVDAHNIKDTRWKFKSAHQACCCEDVILQANIQKNIGMI